MSAFLPTAQDLKKLPMRAVVAYAARTARRVSLGLRGIVPDEVLENALNLIDAVSTVELLNEIEPASVIKAAEQVAHAYATAAVEIKSMDKFYLVFSLVEASLVAMRALLAAADQSTAAEEMERAAQAAERATRPIGLLHGEAANAARVAAIRDYDILLREFGEQNEVVIGPRVECFWEK